MIEARSRLYFLTLAVSKLFISYVRQIVLSKRVRFGLFYANNNKQTPLGQEHSSICVAYNGRKHYSPGSRSAILSPGQIFSLASCSLLFRVQEQPYSHLYLGCLPILKSEACQLMSRQSHSVPHHVMLFTGHSPQVTLAHSTSVKSLKSH